MGTDTEVGQWTWYWASQIRQLQMNTYHWTLEAGELALDSLYWTVGANWECVADNQQLILYNRDWATSRRYRDWGRDRELLMMSATVAIGQMAWFWAIGIDQVTMKGWARNLEVGLLNLGKLYGRVGINGGCAAEYEHSGIGQFQWNAWFRLVELEELIATNFHWKLHCATAIRHLVRYWTIGLGQVRMDTWH